MRRLTVAFLILSFAAVLAACANAGEHFGDFGPTPPPRVPVTNLHLGVNIIAIPADIGFTSRNDVILIVYTTGGVQAGAGTQLQNPVFLTSNYPGYIEFGGPNGPFQSQRAYWTAPGPITLKYTRPPGGACKPAAALVAFSATVAGNQVQPFITDCPSPTPSP
jgi:hypothetical protein